MSDDRLTPKQLRAAIEVAADAHTNLTLFGMIQALAESSDIKAAYHSPALQIVRIYQKTQTRCLSDYDRAILKAGGSAYGK
jgi:hypothetical protein